MFYIFTQTFSFILLPGGYFPPTYDFLLGKDLLLSELYPTLPLFLALALWISLVS